MTKEKEIATKKEYAKRAGLCIRKSLHNRDGYFFNATSELLSEWEVLGNPEFLKKVFNPYPKGDAWVNWLLHAREMSTMSLPERWEYVSHNLDVGK